MFITVVIISVSLISKFTILTYFSETHMPIHHSRTLDEMTGFIVDNIVDINQLVPHLFTEKALCHVTKAYVLAPTTRDQRTMRLLEILSTKQDGMFMLVNVLKKTQSGFLADAIYGE